MTALLQSHKKSKPRVSRLGLRRHRFSVVDYHAMARAGVLKEDDRVELIQGEITDMMPIDPEHAEGTDNVQAALQAKVGVGYRVRCQHPVTLSVDSEPVPDIAVVKAQSYKGQHPGPADVLLIAEVANTSLADDLNRKMLLYAAAGIPEYWVLDVAGNVLHVFSKPMPQGYATHRMLQPKQTVKSKALPQVSVSVKELLA